MYLLRLTGLGLEQRVVYASGHGVPSHRRGTGEHKLQVQAATVGQPNGAAKDKHGQIR